MLQRFLILAVASAELYVWRFFFVILQALSFLSKTAHRAQPYHRRENWKTLQSLERARGFLRLCGGTVGTVQWSFAAVSLKLVGYTGDARTTSIVYKHWGVLLTWLDMLLMATKRTLSNGSGPHNDGGNEHNSDTPLANGFRGTDTQFKGVRHSRKHTVQRRPWIVSEQTGKVLRLSSTFPAKVVHPPTSSSVSWRRGLILKTIQARMCFDSITEPSLYRKNMKKSCS